MRGYYNLAEGMWRLGRYDEALGYIDQAEAYGRDRDFRVYAYMVDARRYRMMGARGDGGPRRSPGCTRLLDGQGDPGMIGRETLPSLTRLLIRQGRSGRGPVPRPTLYAMRSGPTSWSGPCPPDSP